MSDAIFDIVSSGGTLISNGLVEVEKVFYSEAVLIANPELDEQKRRETAQLTFRFNSILESRGMKYVLMNLPQDRSCGSASNGSRPSARKEFWC